MNIDAQTQKVIRVTLGKQIRERRKSFQFTLDEMVKRTGLSKGFLSDVENGKQAPSVVSFMAICSALDWPLPWMGKRA